MKPAPAQNREVNRPQTGRSHGVLPHLRLGAEDSARARELVAEGDRLFASRSPLLTLWQDIAETFYVERADFTAGRSPGSEFAGHLMTGQPLLARQELANAIAGMLRPPGRDWFKLTLKRAGNATPSPSVDAWLEEAEKRMRTAMYERAAHLQRAAKQADNDYVAFGNAVISVDVNWRDTALLYRCWHLRDVAWREDFTGRVDEVHRRWKLSAHAAMTLFPNGFAPELAQMRPEDRRAREIECRHIVLPADRYGDAAIAQRFVSVYVDVAHGHVMEAVGRDTLGYVIPRWQLVSGSVYGYSPTTVASISDARMLQDMTRTILEAGEKAVDPPMVATQEVVRSDLALYAGGITYVDAAYDERLGAALRPISQNSAGLPLGLEMQQDLRRQITAAWMLNKLNLPSPSSGMTAYEVGQRVQEYIRQAIPLFEPIEVEYNGALCEETFAVLSAVGAFGRKADWPEALTGDAIGFKFENPFTAAGDGAALTQYQTVSALLGQQQAIDADALAEVDPRAMFRDAIVATGAPAAWLKDKVEAEAARAAADRNRRLLAGLQQLQAGGRAAEAVGQGAAAIGVDPEAGELGEIARVLDGDAQAAADGEAAGEVEG